MDTIVTMGLVLRETRYKEADRILTILTPELGVISASAPNSLRLKSKLFSACGLSGAAIEIKPWNRKVVTVHWFPANCNIRSETASVSLLSEQ